MRLLTNSTPETHPHPRHAALQLDSARKADRALQLLGLVDFSVLEELHNLDAGLWGDVGEARDGSQG